MNNAHRPAATMNEEINNSRGHVPSRLMAILDHEDVQQSMHWLPDGKAFRISKPTVFIETALKKYFKGVKFLSFQTSLLRECNLKSAPCTIDMTWRVLLTSHVSCYASLCTSRMGIRSGRIQGERSLCQLYLFIFVVPPRPTRAM